MKRYQQQWQVQGSAKKPYVVSLTDNGEWQCSCPAWTRTSPRKDCKHIKRIKGDRSVKEVMDIATRIFSKPPATPYVPPPAPTTPQPGRVQVTVTVKTDGAKPVRRSFDFEE